MKANRIFFEERSTQKAGLKPIKLERLGTVIALVGKNGSGKSRILNFIEDYFRKGLSNTTLTNGSFSGVPQTIIELVNKQNDFKKLLAKRKIHASLIQRRQQDPNNTELAKEYQLSRNEIKINETDLGLVPQTVDSLNRKIQDIQLLIDTDISYLSQNYIKRLKYSDVNLLQEKIEESDNDSISFESLIESVTEQSVYDEFGVIYKSSLTFLKKLPNQLASDWIDCLGDQKKFEKRVSYLRYKSMKEIFETIFGKTFSWEIRNISKEITSNGIQSVQMGIWKINDREFDFNEFSPGEKSLFVYALLIFLMAQNKSIRLKESIIIIDEPELHLHADAEIDLINGIKDLISESGQLWIATHSINILSHLNYEDIFVVREGGVYHPSKTIQREALIELIKIEDKLLKLSEFLSSISEWSYVNFVIECFTNPEVIEVASQSDPQIKSMKDILGNSDKDYSLLLDFGAGKGRLFDQLNEDEKFSKTVVYSALEPNQDFHAILSNKGVSKIYSTYSELPESSFDFIILCNVLHEIELLEWKGILNKIIAALKPTGQIIILEAKTLNKGEFVGPIGYLMLDEEEIAALFKLPYIPDILSAKNSANSITCVRLPKSQLSSISNSDILSAMQLLENNSFKKIVGIREKHQQSETNSKIGRQLAFLSQLHINSKLAQKFLTKPK